MKKRNNIIDEELVAAGLLKIDESVAVFDITKDFEKFFTWILQNLNLGVTLNNFLKVFLKISNGRIIFNSTRKEIKRKLFPNSRARANALNTRIQYRFDRLKDLESRSKLIKELKLKEGGIDGYTHQRNPDIYEYTFLILRELKEFIRTNPDDNRMTKQVATKFVSRLRNRNVKSQANAA